MRYPAELPDSPNVCVNASDFESWGEPPDAVSESFATRGTVEERTEFDRYNFAYSPDGEKQIT